MTFARKWKYPTRDSTGEKVLAYIKWQSMKHRCQVGGVIQNTRPTYIGCTYTPEWESYDHFYEWITKQIGYDVLDEKGRQFNLDKDLLHKGNKLYSPDTCVLIPNEINAFLHIPKRFRGDLPRGVSQDKGCYVARVRVGGVQKFIGSYIKPEEAFQSYKLTKQQCVKQLAIKYTGLVDPRVIDALNNYEVDIND